MPKICISTISQHGNWSYTQNSGIILWDSCTDVGGLNQVSELVYLRAAGAICGMAKQFLPRSRSLNISAVATSEENRVIRVGISMFGNTTSCVDACRLGLDAQGYECLIFHAVGTGGMKLESFVRERAIDAVLDVTTTEIADFVGNGVFSAGRERLSAPGEMGIPHLIIPGCLDMINLGPYEIAKRQFPNRDLLICNADVTVMRTTVEENIEMGELIAAKANAARGPVAILIPLKGLSMFEETIPNWHDPYANEALFCSIKSNLKEGIPLIGIEVNINHRLFAQKANEIFLALIRRERPRSKIITIIPGSIQETDTLVDTTEASTKRDNDSCFITRPFYGRFSRASSRPTRPYDDQWRSLRERSGEQKEARRARFDVENISSLGGYREC